MLKNLLMIYIVISLTILVLLQVKRKKIEDILLIRNKLFLISGKRGDYVDPSHVDLLGIIAIIPFYRWYLFILLIGLTVNEDRVVNALIEDFVEKASDEE